MRISTAQIYSTNVASIQRQQADLLHLQQQLSTGQRVITPSDDPVASARALIVAQSDSLNTMQMKSQGIASDNLKMLDSMLGSIGDVLSYLKTQSIQAGDGALSVADKQNMAADIKAQFDALVNLANTKDANDEYMFAGYKGDTQPFTGGLVNVPPSTLTLTSSVAYQGDQGTRCLQISNSRQIPTNVNGDELFMKIDDGTGTGNTTDVFNTVANFVTTLQDTSLPAATYTANLSSVMNQLDKALDNVLTLRSQTGSRMVEVDSINSISQDLTVQYAATTERLVGVDYASAISDYQQQKTYLEAALNSFSQVSGLSLFNYIK